MIITVRRQRSFFNLVLSTSLWAALFVSTEGQSNSFGSAAVLQTLPLISAAPVPKDFGSNNQEWKCQMTCTDGAKFNYSLNVRVPKHQVYEMRNGKAIPKYCFMPSAETLQAATNAYCGSDEKLQTYDCAATGTDGRDHDCSFGMF